MARQVQTGPVSTNLASTGLINGLARRVADAVIDTVARAVAQKAFDVTVDATEKWLAARGQERARRSDIDTFRS